MDEDLYRLNEENREGSWRDAIQSLEEMQLPMTLTLPEKIRGLTAEQTNNTHAPTNTSNLHTRKSPSFLHTRNG